MFGAAPIRSVATELGVTPRTVLRWRRRQLALLSERVSPGVAGRVEVFIFKPIHTRTGLRIIAAVDDGGRRAALVLPTPTTVGAVAEAFRHLVAPGSEILLAHVARDVFRRGIEAAGFPVSRVEPAAARAWGRRVARWLGRFRGTWDAAAHAAWFMAVESSRDGRDFATRWLGDAG